MKTRIIFAALLLLAFCTTTIAQSESKPKTRVLRSAMTRDSLETPIRRDTMVTIYTTPNGSDFIILHSNGPKPFYTTWVPRRRNKK